MFRDPSGYRACHTRSSTPPLEAGAFATHTMLVVCQPEITVTKTADALAKITDPVNYTIQVCNTGLIDGDQDERSPTR